MSGKKLDLSKCKPGDRVRLRNGTETNVARNTGLASYPVELRNGISYTYNGEHYYGHRSELDIVAILPRAKPKKPAEKPEAPAQPKLPEGVFRVADMIGKTVVIEGSKNDGTFSCDCTEVFGVYKDEKAALKDLADRNADEFDESDKSSDGETWASDCLIVEVKRVVRPVPRVKVNCDIRVVAGGAKDAR